MSTMCARVIRANQETQCPRLSLQVAELNLKVVEPIIDVHESHELRARSARLWVGREPEQAC
jgi:hypothetical protein